VIFPKREQSKFYHGSPLRNRAEERLRGTARAISARFDPAALHRESARILWFAAGADLQNLLEKIRQPKVETFGFGLTFTP
jgi:hypothetical protein